MIHTTQITISDFYVFLVQAFVLCRFGASLSTSIILLPQAISPFGLAAWLLRIMLMKDALDESGTRRFYWDKYFRIMVRQEL
jgi:hypothetical protein